MALKPLEPTPLELRIAATVGLLDFCPFCGANALMHSSVNHETMCGGTLYQARIVCENYKCGMNVICNERSLDYAQCGVIDLCSKRVSPADDPAQQVADKVDSQPVAYLEVDKEGYVDLGSDKSIEELEAFPPGKYPLYMHPAQPDPTMAGDVEPSEADIQGLCDALEGIPLGTWTVAKHILSLGYRRSDQPAPATTVGELPEPIGGSSRLMKTGNLMAAHSFTAQITPRQPDRSPCIQQTRCASAFSQPARRISHARRNWNHPAA